jgi:hypothetical protein
MNSFATMILCLLAAGAPALPPATCLNTRSARLAAGPGIAPLTCEGGRPSACRNSDRAAASAAW